MSIANTEKNTKTTETLELADLARIIKTWEQQGTISNKDRTYVVNTYSDGKHIGVVWTHTDGSSSVEVFNKPLPTSAINSWVQSGLDYATYNMVKTPDTSGQNMPLHKQSDKTELPPPAVEEMASSMMQPPQPQGRGDKYLVIVGTDSNFDKEQFANIMLAELDEEVAFNTVLDRARISVFDCSDAQKALNLQWFRTYVAGHCLIESIGKGGVFMDQEIDQTGSISRAIIDMENQQGEEDED